MRRRGAAVPVAAAALLAACGSGEPDTPPAEPAPAEGVFGRAPPAVAGVPSVVLLSTSAPLDLPLWEEPHIDQLGLQFIPGGVLARPGEPVLFTNSESLAHNVHVRALETDSTVFDHDTQPTERVRMVLDEEGAYDVGCDVHPGMRSFIFVTGAPFAALADAEGRFHLSGVPAGEYTLRIWSADPSQRSERSITVTEGAATEVSPASSG